MSSRRAFLTALAILALGGCASLPHRDPLQVTIAGVQSLPGEGMELRLLLKLRIQNPNGDPIDYDGAYVELEVQDRTFASGVSSEAGVVPAFGETVISVPVTVSVMRMVRQVMGVLDGRPVDRITYRMSGKLSGGLFDTVRFNSSGEFKLPTPEPAATHSN
jgi:LEA14-like dessication related protein